MNLKIFSFVFFFFKINETPFCFVVLKGVVPNTLSLLSLFIVFVAQITDFFLRQCSQSILQCKFISQLIVDELR